MRRVGIRALSAPQIRVVLLEVPLEPHAFSVGYGGRSRNRSSLPTLATTSCSSDLVRQPFVTNSICHEVATAYTATDLRRHRDLNSLAAGDDRRRPLQTRGARCLLVASSVAASRNALAPHMPRRCSRHHGFLTRICLSRRSPLRYDGPTGPTRAGSSRRESSRSRAADSPRASDDDDDLVVGIATRAPSLSSEPFHPLPCRHAGSPSAVRRAATASRYRRRPAREIRR